MENIDVGKSWLEPHNDAAASETLFASDKFNDVLFSEQWS